MRTKILLLSLLPFAISLTGCDVLGIDPNRKNPCQQQGKECCVIETGPQKYVQQCVVKSEAASECGRIASQYPKFDQYPTSQISSSSNACE
jgi:hypothetical protein